MVATDIPVGRAREIEIGAAVRLSLRALKREFALDDEYPILEP